jgi:acetyl-CoA carboxylase biotin carboxyl carrier protein
MTQALDLLTDADVRQIISLIDSLDRSHFDHLQIDVGTFKLTLGKGQWPADHTVAPSQSSSLPAPAPVASPAAPTAPAPALAPALVAPSPAAAPQAATASAAKSPAKPLPQADWLPVAATTMGRFYSRPDPNSAPFVQLGDRVQAEDTVCLIEVMKLFNAIPAGVSGTVVQVCVQDTDVVEYGQVLFFVQA